MSAGGINAGSGVGHEPVNVRAPANAEQREALKMDHKQQENNLVPPMPL